MDLSFIMLDPFVGFYEVTLNFFPWISRRVLQNGNKRKGGGGGVVVDANTPYAVSNS